MSADPKPAGPPADIERQVERAMKAQRAERRRQVESEVELAAARRELALAQLAARALVFAWEADSRPPPHLADYARNLPVQLPKYPTTTAHLRRMARMWKYAAGAYLAKVEELEAELERLKGEER